MRKKRAAGTASVRASSFLDDRSAQAERIETLVQHADEVVLRVAERLGRHGARIGQRVPALFREEPQRVAQHLGEVVLHQQRLVLVDRQRRVALGRVERRCAAVPCRRRRGSRTPTAARRCRAADPSGSPSRSGAPRPAPRCASCDHALVVEADEARQAPPRPALDDAVEIDEEDRLAGPVRVRDARAQAAGDEREVRVGVPRLDRALLGIEIVAALQPVVLVAGALRKQRRGTPRRKSGPCSALSRAARLRSRNPAVVCDDQYRQCG